MKIHLMGPPDLVPDWAKLFESTFGLTGRVYPNRNSSDVRYYLDLDDCVAERVISGQEATAVSFHHLSESQLSIKEKVIEH